MYTSGPKHFRQERLPALLSPKMTDDCSVYRLTTPPHQKILSNSTLIFYMFSLLYVELSLWISHSKNQEHGAFTCFQMWSLRISSEKILENESLQQLGKEWAPLGPITYSILDKLLYGSQKVKRLKKLPDLYKATEYFTTRPSMAIFKWIYAKI